jgi:16S rRNA (guanine1207-N2)-methyltransferase
MGARASTSRSNNDVAELVLDAGVLAPAPVLEIFGWRAAANRGGRSILPQRRDWLDAHQQQVAVVADPLEIEGERFSQCVVHLQKGRAATWQGLASGWQHLEPCGRLLLCGCNQLGVKSAVKALARELAQGGEIVANRAKGRVVGWRRSDHPGPAEPPAGSFEVDSGQDRFRLASASGLFSADAVDPGSQLLLEHLEAIGPARTLFDPGCGSGLLGLAALRQQADSSAVLADADWRAVACARGNGQSLGLADRLRVVWWDAVCEKPPLDSCDAALVNPPFHSGKAVDLAPAKAIFKALAAVLTVGGRALIVTLRTLPFERDLRAIGQLEEVAVRAGYKLLLLRR